jgi:replicative DNA helicase
LRSSGELEQNADVVLGLYRDEYYHPEGTPEYDPSRRNLLEVLILKQRNGKANPMGEVKVGIYYEANTGFMGNWRGDNRQ